MLRNGCWDGIRLPWHQWSHGAPWQHRWQKMDGSIPFPLPPAAVPIASLPSRSLPPGLACMISQSAAEWRPAVPPSPPPCHIHLCMCQGPTHGPAGWGWVQSLWGFNCWATNPSVTSQLFLGFHLMGFVDPTIHYPSLNLHITCSEVLLHMTEYYIYFPVIEFKTYSMFARHPTL